HVDDDPIALLDSEVAQHGAEDLGFGPEPVIGQDAPRSGERRIVHDGGLRAPPAHHVAGDGVPAGVADSIGEPASVNAGIGIENALWRRIPVNLARRLRPEGFWVLLPARIGLGITA